MRGAGPFSVVLVAALAATGLGGGDAGAAKPRGPDLVVAAKPSVPASVVPAAKFRVKDRVKNAGTRRARKSVVRYYLSLNKKRDKLDRRLTARRRVRALRAGKGSRGKAVLVVPGQVALGRYRLVACADDRKRVRERRERNNCRASAPLQLVAQGTELPRDGGGTAPGLAPVDGSPPTEADGDADDDGVADDADCRPFDGAVHPGAPDSPDGDVADTNCDGIDGSASEAVFVSPLGSDTSPGTREQPKRTVAGGIGAAAGAAKDVYIAVGTYDETLEVANGVSVYGGYGTDWTRARSGVTRLASKTDPQGSTFGARASGVTEPTTLQQLTLAPREPVTPGASSYGLRAVGSPGLVIESVVAIGAKATYGAPGATGPAGVPGSPGGMCSRTDRTSSRSGGGSPGGHAGGAGGRGGATYDWSSGDGEAGARGAGPYGGVGGQGGEEGDPGQEGADGLPGRDGVPGTDGAGAAGGSVAGGWFTRAGASATPGTTGSGGGGGGGGSNDTTGVEDSYGLNGGGGGGGGQGGWGGGGGRGGGGSFGVFAERSPGMVIRNSELTASDGGTGGRGGPGGAGGNGGAGGIGCPSWNDDAWDGNGWHAGGGDGGRGGHGQSGGDGGGGAGGPSVALYTHESAVDSESNKLAFGQAGAGGTGGDGTAFTKGSGGFAGATNPRPKPRPGLP